VRTVRVNVSARNTVVNETRVGGGMVKWFLGEAVRQLSDNAVGLSLPWRPWYDDDVV
jgi:hypothetical protein